ncbi:Calmodulin-like protein [Thalictrum thalictroides]|uniref:Calmodulin-like protein n=1 Tax=Thalictrum thalictroides TaxID=46969 RepID=A0A7J6WRY9_THATH|nr:Calmodulin-like protein [Thalictrum thalictroides]
MPGLSLLNFQYNVSKKFPSKPGRWGSSDKQLSGLSVSYQPNVEEMKKVFDKFNANKDGKISKQEYRAVLRALGKQNLDEEVPKIFKVADTNEDGFIDFKEFMDLHEKGGGIKQMDIRNAFRSFDLDGNGRISAEELLEVMMKLGERCTLVACKKMVRAVDTDGDDLIDMKEFMKMMTETMKMC